MSFDIDMTKYAGEIQDSAAESPQIVDTNLYGDVEDFPVHQELLENADSKSVEAPEVQESNPQADNFRALREEVDRIKHEREVERKVYQEQIEMLRANKVQSREPEAPKEMFNGMKDDDIPSVGEMRREWQAREAGYKSQLEEMQVQQTHSDYAEVLEKFTLPLLEKKPHLAEGIRGASNKALYAYELGKMAQQMHVPQVQAQQSINALKIVANAKKPGNLANVGGQNVLGKADYYATMSDQEFMRMASRNLEGI